MIDITVLNEKYKYMSMTFYYILFVVSLIKLNKFLQHETTSNYHLLFNRTLLNISVYGLMEYNVTDFGRWPKEIL
jgi:hypothetical protein